MPALKPEISIIIVSYNTAECLQRCIAHLEKEKDALEIIVVDNASTDDSANLIKTKFPFVKLISNRVNEGFGSANNRGAEKASGKYLVLLNSDAFPKPGALSTALKKMQENPKIGIGGARLIDAKEIPQHSARSFPSVLNDFLRLSGLADRFPDSRFFGHAEKTWMPQDKPMQVDWVTGAFMIIPKSLYQQAGGFDERFFLYYEEVDLCKKVKELGLQIWYWPDVIVEHIGGISSEQFSSRREKWRMQSALLYYRKHHGYWGACSAKWMEQTWHRLRILRNTVFNTSNSAEKIKESKAIIKLMEEAWQDTDKGTFSPAKPWI